MPTLELDFSQADEVIEETVLFSKGGKDKDYPSPWLDAYYKNAETRLLNLYESARLGAWRIDEVKGTASYWLDWCRFFEGILENFERSRKKLKKAALPPIPALDQAAQTTSEILEATRGSYKFFA